MHNVARQVLVKLSPSHGAQGSVFRKVYRKLNHEAPYFFPQIRFPSVIEIELTNDCNLGCPHCARSIMERNIGYMDYRLFTSIADQVSQHPYTYLRIVGLGEPSLHPQIGKILDYVKDRKIKTDMVTNGHLLDIFSPEQVIDSGLDFLGISIDGFDEHSYNKRRPGGDYIRLKTNIINLWNTRKKMMRNRPLIKIRHVIYPNDSEEDLNNYRDFWFNYADMVNFNKYISIKEGHFSEPYNRCRHIKFEIKINWNGDVPVCRFQTRTREKEHLIGNLKRNTIQEIWMGASMEEARTIHANKDFDKMAYCKSCTKVQSPGRCYSVWKNPKDFIGYLLKK
jgi:wyosine [tRNA(Phe)-imidazoG37] synthetase (radical SAM superfamily)